jgi:hypothetical protein
MPNKRNIPLESWLRRTVMPTTADTETLRSFEQDALNQSVFSATNDMADFLTALQKQVAEILAGKKDQATVMLELDQLLEVMEYRAPLGKENTIQDLASWARKKLVVKTNVQAAQGYGQYVSSHEEGALLAYPAWKVITTRAAVVPRDWPERWTVSARRAGDDDARRLYTKTGVMAALVTSPIWDALGNRSLWPDALGNPWAPFYFNSGKEVAGVGFRQAAAWNLIKPGQKQKPVEVKPFKAAGMISDALTNPMAAAVRQNLEGQGFSFDAAGELLAGPVAGAIHRLFHVERPKTAQETLADLDTALAPPEEQLLNRLDEALREAA